MKAAKREKGILLKGESYIHLAL